MQERYIFREMLSEIKELADQKGNVLTLDEVKEFFKNARLTDEQLNMVCVYLIGEKIRVEGYEGPEKQEQTPEKEEAGAMEESDCLELYQAELEEIKGLSEEEELKCFQLASAGDSAAKSRLTEHYLKTVYDLTTTFAFGSVPRSHLIQDGNLALVLAEIFCIMRLENWVIPVTVLTAIVCAINFREIFSMLNKLVGKFLHRKKE